MRSVQGYEAGDVIPYKHFRRLEEITGKSVAWFLRGEEAIPESPGGASFSERMDAMESRLERVEELTQAVLDAVQQPQVA